MNEWRKLASCRNKFVDFWFPPVDVGNISQYFSVAKAVCDRCPVWKLCLNDGMDENWGMWGGLMPNEIKAIKAEGAHLKPHGTPTRYRQGCACSSCEKAHNVELKPLDLNIIPNLGDLVDVPLVKELVMKSIS